MWQRWEVENYVLNQREAYEAVVKEVAAYKASLPEEDLVDIVLPRHVPGVAELERQRLALEEAERVWEVEEERNVRAGVWDRVWDSFATFPWRW